MDFTRGKLPGDAEANALVERALFLAATGYWYTEEKRETSEKGGEKVTRTRKQAAPNVSAIALWLSHRVPERWGDETEPPSENNLFAMLREEWEGGEGDEVSAIQSQTKAGHDLVETEGIPQAGRDSV